jgi:hypothetical protein
MNLNTNTLFIVLFVVTDPVLLFGNNYEVLSKDQIVTASGIFSYALKADLENNFNSNLNKYIAENNKTLADFDSYSVDAAYYPVNQISQITRENNGIGINNIAFKVFITE